MSRKKFDDAPTKEGIKKHGAVVSRGNDILDEKNDLETITVSPSIDIALGGGIKEGSWVILTGDPKSGKTTTALQIAANCQNEKNPRPVVYIDAEGRLKAMNLSGVKGLNLEDVRVVHSDEEPLSAEQFLDIAVKLVSSKEFYRCVCIIDSTSSLIPEKELNEDITGSFRAGLPRILAIFCRKLANIVSMQRATIIVITHFIANTSGYGAHRLPDCGRKIQYQADTRMEVKSIKPWESGSKQIGQQVNWRIVCSSMGSPGGECLSWLRYGKGIDNTQELLTLGCEIGLISKAGAWYQCDFLEEKEPKKFQGQDRLYTFLKENPEALLKLQEQIKEML